MISSDIAFSPSVKTVQQARGTPCASGKNGEISAIWRSLSKNKSSITGLPNQKPL